MRVIACLSWYDEDPAWLAELVASLVGAGVSHLVAVDGAYLLYPQGRGNSGSTASSVLTAAALGAGMGVTVHQPALPWTGNEIEKRNMLFELAHMVAEPGEDWLLVIDGDQVVSDGFALRPALEQTDADVAELMLIERVGGGREMGSSMHRMCFRADSGGITVQDRHCRYVAGDGRVLWDAARPGEEVEALTLMDVRVLHRPADRDPYRTDARLAYYQRVREFATEAL